MHTYYAEECIFDLLAASGPQEIYSINMECCNQCNSPEFDPSNTIGECMIAAGTALTTLINAGLVEEGGKVFELTNYAYDIIVGFRERQREYDSFLNYGERL